MNHRGFINILLVVIVVALVGTGAYFVATRQTTPTPIPIPTPTPTPTPTPLPTPKPSLTPKPSPTPKPVSIPGLRFEASPMLGAPPLNVSIGAFTQSPLQFDTFILDYGDGSQETLSQQCISDVCQVRSEHKYTFSGTFTATLRGIKNDTSQIIGTLTIAVGNPLIVTKTVGEKESSFLIQKINQDSVDGLWYEAYPVATGRGTPKTLHIGDNIGYGCEGVSDKLTSIDFSGQNVSFTVSWSKPPFGGCPICLASNTLIDTPVGLVPVKDLQVGMSVWTTDKIGQRVFGIIIKTSKVLVPPNHQMVHLALSDGRDLFVSPGHPTIDGRNVGDLVSGDVYDGATIVSATPVPYGENSTYDLLPSGDTGFYWANGILISSTLR